MTETALAEQIEAAFIAAEDWDYSQRRKLARKLSEIERSPETEVEQFRLLQAAVRDSPALAEAFDASGFESLATWDTRRVTAETGAFIQAFNRLVESGWSAI